MLPKAKAWSLYLDYTRPWYERFVHDQQVRAGAISIVTAVLTVLLLRLIGL